MKNIKKLKLNKKVISALVDYVFIYHENNIVDNDALKNYNNYLLGLLKREGFCNTDVNRIRAISYATGYNDQGERDKRYGVLLFIFETFNSGATRSTRVDLSKCTIDKVLNREEDAV